MPHTTNADDIEKPPRWARQPGESAKAYEAFSVYRDLGADRSLVAAYARAKGCQIGVKRVPGTWQEWSVVNCWVPRCFDYDAHIDAKARKKREADHIAALEAHRKKLADLGAAMMTGAAQSLMKGHTAAGKIDTESLSPYEIASLLRSAAALAMAGLAAEAEALGIGYLTKALLDGDGLFASGER